MLRSSDSLPAGARLEADVCVIGAGAAGLALAREFLATARRVCLLESGGRWRGPAPDPLYDVRATHMPVPNDSRVRGFGGTTTVWRGRWKRLDPIDFEARDWVPHSGWPITAASLDPYYERADRAAGVSQEDGESAAAASFLPSDAVVPTVFRTLTLDHRDFGRASAASIDAAAHIDAVVDAHVVGLETGGRAVRRVLVRGRAGRPFSVEAKLVVLAAGGIENARLLLIADIGNRQDQVGRYFMEHPKAKVGMVETYDPVSMSSWKGMSEDAPIWVGFRLSDRVLRTERLLNSYVFLAPAFEVGLVQRLAYRARMPASFRLLIVRNYMEQAPAPDNRVFLVRGESDPFGLPRAGVTWSLGALDRQSLVALHRHLLRELQRAGIGELYSPLLRPDAEFPEVQDASHHMGTTRMGTDPRTSVVDPDGRVHDSDNLFVAGSSVFPTAGYANPTATIAALAVRLADHLKGRL